MLRKYVIEREVPGVGSSSPEGFCAIAEKSNGVLGRLGTRIQWVHSYVAADKTFCIYLAESEELIREHARLSGFPANRITEVVTVIDPSTARRAALSEAV
jgi:hypothetical protein